MRRQQSTANKTKTNKRTNTYTNSLAQNNQKREQDKRKELWKQIEDEKHCLFLRNTSCPDILKRVQNDLQIQKKPNAIQYKLDEKVSPFDDSTYIEKQCEILNASLFILGTNTKKRKNTIIFGRTYNNTVRDMLEFQIIPETYHSMQEYIKERTKIARTNTKPIMIFLGELFETDNDMKTLRSILLDIFHGTTIDKVNPESIDRAIVVAVVEDNDKKKIQFRQYTFGIWNERSDMKKLQLQNVGPNFDAIFNRSVYGPQDIIEESIRVPHNILKPNEKLLKNVERGQFNTRIGRVHMQSQKLNELSQAKYKALGKRYNPDAKRVIRGMYGIFLTAVRLYMHLYKIL